MAIEYAKDPAEFEEEDAELVEDGIEDPTEEENANRLVSQEDALLAGMMQAARYKDEKEARKEIVIKRQGKELFRFWIRPITEAELADCVKKATKYYKNPQGRHLPRIEGDTDMTRMRSYKILQATVNSDKIWNNTTLKQKLNLLDPVDVVDTVLLAGEKDQIDDIIDDISGFGVDIISKEDYVKNS